MIIYINVKLKNNELKNYQLHITGMHYSYSFSFFTFLSDTGYPAAQFILIQYQYWQRYCIWLVISEKGVITVATSNILQRHICGMF